MEPPRHEGPGHHAGGRYHGINSIHVYTVKDGRIAHFINYFDSMPLLRATYDVEFKKPGAARKGGR